MAKHSQVQLNWTFKHKIKPLFSEMCFFFFLFYAFLVITGTKNCKIFLLNLFFFFLKSQEEGNVIDYNGE